MLEPIKKIVLPEYINLITPEFVEKLQKQRKLLQGMSWVHK